MTLSHWIYTLILNSLAVLLTAYLLKGVQVSGFLNAVLAALLLGFVNSFIRPVLILLTLPVTILTLGLFVLVINALMVMLVGAILPGFSVKNFWWALGFSIILSLVNSLLFWLF